MALPPTPAPPAGGPAPGGAVPDMGAAAPDDTGTEDMGDNADEEANEPQVFFTVMKTPDGKYILIDGDEPEPDEMGEGEPGAMDQSGVNGPTLLKEIMAKVQADEGGGAEKAFGDSFQGKKKGPPPPNPPPMGA